MMQNKAFILIVLIVVFVSGTLLYIYNPDPTEYRKPEEKIKACTMEAKMCPDGTYVGREGPDCEFTNCPIIDVKIPGTPSMQ